MVDRTNVNDAEWPNDWYRNNDVLRDLNSEEQAIRDIMIDIYGAQAWIFSGLVVEDGATADTFKITAGRARDNNKYHILLGADHDNEPCFDATGLDNFIAIRHIWAYSEPDAAVKSGIAYNRVRSDHYEINVAAAAHAEAAGWVRLARAYKVGGVWCYDMEYGIGNPNYGRSREAELDAWTIDFAYWGVLAGAVLLDRHSLIALDLWRVPFDFLVCRVEVDVRVADPAAATTFDLFQNGVIHPSWGAGVTLILPATDTNAIWYNDEGLTSTGEVFYSKNDLIQVSATPLGAGPTDIALLISGRKLGGV